MERAAAEDGRHPARRQGHREASLRGFFSISPLLFALFLPAVTMRAIAEERKTGTLELLLTMPLRDYEVVLGKFLAALAMVAVGLLFTFPYAFTVASGSFSRRRSRTRRSGTDRARR